MVFAKFGLAEAYDDETAIEAVKAYEAVVALELDKAYEAEKAYDELIALLAQLAVPVNVPINEPVNDPVLYEALNAKNEDDKVDILELLLRILVLNDALEAR